MQRRVLVVSAIVMMVAVACGDDDATTESTVASTAATEATTTTTAAPTTTTTEAPTTTAGAVPESSVTSTLAGTYTFGGGTGEATPDQLGFDPAAVTVHWFRGSSTYVAVYQGLDPTASMYLCPGNSIFQDTGWFHVSNAPAPGSDCSAAVGFGSTVIDSTPGASGTQVCNGTLSYITAIPNDQDGDLFGTVEVFPPDGVFFGASGSTGPLAAVDVPDIDESTLSC